MAAISARVRRGSGPTASQTRNVPAAITSTVGTKTSAMRSARRCDRRLRSLGALDELDDAGERRVAPDPRRPHDERAGRVERRPDDLVAGALADRDRLAGQHRLVDRRRPFDDEAVDRHLVAGPDAEQVADDDRVERDVLLELAAHEARRDGPERDEPADGAGRLALGARLEPAAEQDEADDDRRAVEVGRRAPDRRPRRPTARASRRRCTPRPRSCRSRRACPCWWSRGGRPARPSGRTGARPTPG